MKNSQDNSRAVRREEQSKTPTFQHLWSKKHKFGSLWLNAVSTNQEALTDLQCKWQAGKQRLRGIRAMNLPLSRLGSSIRNTPISQPSCYLALTCLTNSSITTSLFGWRAHSELCHFPALPLQGKEAQPTMLRGTTTTPWACNSTDTALSPAFVFVVVWSKSHRLLSVMLSVVAVG